MAKNLPPSWDPGYAQPPNVKAEGIQRRAFVTKWAPRGTYDSSTNPTGGYAQPPYVMAEGTGQGTFVTDWVPGGSYMGPGIPHWMNQLPGESQQYVKIKPGGPAAPSGAPLSIPSGMGALGATATAGRGVHPYAGYGTRAATVILNNVRKLPVAQRKTALKQILGKVDPTLYDRVASQAQQHISRGVSPNAAVHKAMSQAFTAGLTKDVISLGKGHRPRSRSHLGLSGLGCTTKSRSSLGAALSSLVAAATSTPSTTTEAAAAQVWPSTVMNGVTVTDGQCTADGKFVWFHGQWRIMTPGDPACANNSTVTSAQVMTAGIQLYVGPFPLTGNQVGAYGLVQTYQTPGSLPAGALEFIGQKIVQAAQAAGLASGGSALSSTYGPFTQAMDLQSLGAGNCPINGAPPQCSTTASLAQALPGLTGQVTVGTDSQGNQCHIYSTSTNPNAGQWYDVCDWLNAIEIAPTTAATTVAWGPSRSAKTVGIIDGTQMCDVQASPLTSLFDQFQETGYGDPSPADGDAPFFKYIDPITGDTWGVWLAFGLDSTAVNSPGVYVSALGRPQSVHLEVGFAPIPDCSLCFLSTILEYIFWLPGQLFILGAEAVAVVVGSTLSVLGTLACDVMTNPNAVSAGAIAGKAAGGAVGSAAGAAGAAAAQAACGGAKLPQLPTTDDSWIIPVALLGLGAVFLLTRKKKPKASSTSP
jgi:hypothetical protein